MTVITREELENNPLFRDDIVRTDLDGDELLSLNLLYAATDHDWQRVEKLLSEGADPRMCRLDGGYSALFVALASARFDIAEKLYEAGDRLDDFCEAIAGKLDYGILEFLAEQMRDGKNYFFDESRSFSEYCRIAYFSQIEKNMESVSGEELNEGFIKLIHAAADRMCTMNKGSWYRPHSTVMEKYIICLEKMVACGARFESRDDGVRIAEYLNGCRPVLRSKDNLAGPPGSYEIYKRHVEALNSVFDKLIAFVEKNLPRGS